MIVGIDCGGRKVTMVSSEGHTAHIVVKKTDRASELSELITRVKDTLKDWGGAEYLFVEEAVVAGRRNLRVALMLAETVGAVLSIGIPATKVPVATWKKSTVGSGNASKGDVARWYRLRFPESKYHDNQDICDAAAICQHGQGVMALSRRLGARG